MVIVYIWSFPISEYHWTCGYDFNLFSLLVSKQYQKNIFTL